VSAAGLLAFCAAALGALAVVLLARGFGRRAVAGAERLVAAAAGALDALLRLGREGREPGALERRRLLACGGAGGFCTGLLVAGPLVGAAVAVAAPAAVARALRARRIAYRRAVARDAAAIAAALADALTGGHSLRGALAQAAASVRGAGGAELRRVAAGLAAGEQTEHALEALRERCATPPIDAITTAALVQRRSGGDLSALLRRLARAFDDEQRLVAEARVATAQARFTGLLVGGLPLAGAALAEMASPGFAGRLLGSPVTAWLVAAAVAMQVAAGLLIRRLGRVRW